MDNKKEENHEEIVIQKYKKIENMNTVVMAISIFLLPIIVILLLIAEFNQFENMLMILKILLIVVISVMMIFFLFIRRCPNCRARFDKYVLSPTYCPFCRIRLKK